MRNAFCKALVDSAARENFIFLTGDLGFKALEPLRDAMGNRFINAGVAEQNMVSVSAALACSGLRPWAYSIAPFMYARPFEQIRNDVCLHDLPVVMVGNGGGYGYGVMGATHHALEDYGALLTLPHLRAFIPAFDGDVTLMVRQLMDGAHPAYLRLGLSEEPKGMALPPYAPWRKMCNGGGATIVGIGPIAGGIATAVKDLDENRRPAVWVVTELPIDELPPPFLDDLAASKHLVVVEEHAVHGGAGEMLAHRLLLSGKAPARFSHRAARGYVSGRYGSQAFHRRESGIDAASIVAELSGGPAA